MYSGLSQLPPYSTLRRQGLAEDLVLARLRAEHIDKVQLFKDLKGIDGRFVHQIDALRRQRHDDELLFKARGELRSFRNEQIAQDVLLIEPGYVVALICALSALSSSATASSVPSDAAALSALAISAFASSVSSTVSLMTSISARTMLPS